MTPIITDAQFAQVNLYVEALDYAGGWAYLASIGDNYADNASAVISATSVASQGRIFALLVERHWENTAGRTAYEQKFEAVALQHFQQHVGYIRKEHGKLPTTEDIEKSYRTAVEQNGLSAYVAFDGIFTQSLGKLTGKSIDWPDFLGIDAARQVESHVFDDLDSSKSAQLLIKAVLEAELSFQGELQLANAETQFEGQRAMWSSLAEVLSASGDAAVRVWGQVFEYVSKLPADIQDQYIRQLLNTFDDSYAQCFPAGTPILAGDGSERLIEDIRPGDMVMAFDGLGELAPRKVVRLFENATEEWLEPSFPGDRAPITVTPGHEFLTPKGDFRKIGDMVDAEGRVEIVLADGTVTKASVRRIAFSSDIADLYEQAQATVAAGTSYLTSLVMENVLGGVVNSLCSALGAAGNLVAPKRLWRSSATRGLSVAVSDVALSCP
ncbi:Hint domain-containing protein [Ciceribacter sp. RN22]|uniref:Hint domain-containing protein n=1 Tax=Ciceribacter sp. RN22 TaxID=2954932 RepID=UPI0020924013|nr:Hint domain-containing protein [Ciceribacter sp. RN22]MCO6181037.1 Hint domain-containing protein [Ciceribacter sp. RN22]